MCPQRPLFLRKGRAALRISKSGQDPPHTHFTTYSRKFCRPVGHTPGSSDMAQALKGHCDTFCLLDPKDNPPTSMGTPGLVWQGLTLTLKVIASITKMRSGKTLATSSTLLKYLTGSRTSRACSRSLNFPTKDEHRLLGQACPPVPPSCSPRVSQPLWNRDCRKAGLHSLRWKGPGSWLKGGR